jgi:hypothetical protein
MIYSDNKSGLGACPRGGGWLGFNAYSDPVDVSWWKDPEDASNPHSCEYYCAPARAAQAKLAHSASFEDPPGFTKDPYFVASAKALFDPQFIAAHPEAFDVSKIMQALESVRDYLLPDSRAAYISCNAGIWQPIMSDSEAISKRLFPGQAGTALDITNQQRQLVSEYATSAQTQADILAAQGLATSQTQLRLTQEQLATQALQTIQDAQRKAGLQILAPTATGIDPTKPLAPQLTTTQSEQARSPLPDLASSTPTPPAGVSKTLGIVALGVAALIYFMKK